MVLLSGKPLAANPAQLAAQFVAPFDWDAIVDRLDQLLMLAMLRREHAALGALLQLSRVELVSIDTESQSCRVTETLAVLLALPGAAARSAAGSDCSRYTGKNCSNGITAMSLTASGCSIPSAAPSSRAWALKPSTTSGSIAITSGAYG